MSVLNDSQFVALHAINSAPVQKPLALVNSFFGACTFVDEPYKSLCRDQLIKMKISEDWIATFTLTKKGRALFEKAQLSPTLRVPFDERSSSDAPAMP